jgi:hypothetical protein
VLLDRPLGDLAINEAIWRVVDEQVIAPAERKALAVNGLRIGRVIGELPREIDTILKEEPGPNRTKVVPSNIMLESGQQTLISTSPRVAEVNLLITREDGATGRPYRDASGYFRLTPHHHGEHAVSLRLVPEIHHGPIQRTFPSVPNAAGLAPQELTIRDAQKEESIRELAVDLVLEEGQVAVIGWRPEKAQSLGTFLFSQPAAENDERHQRLVLIWASRNLTGVIPETPKAATSDRPKLFRRLVGGPAEPPPTPAPPDPAPPNIAGPPSPTPKTPAPTTKSAAAGSAKATAKPPATDAAPSAAPPPDTQTVPPLPGGSGQP